VGSEMCIRDRPLAEEMGDALERAAPTGPVSSGG
jgi:hypothetical protein